MARGRPKVVLMLSEAETAQLSSIARSRSMSAALTQRAQIVLGCAAGESNHTLAQRMALTDATVGKWRRRFLQYRIQGCQRQSNFPHRVASRNFVTGCLTSDVTGTFLPVSFRSGCKPQSGRSVCHRRRQKAGPIGATGD